ncbi:NAD(P)H-binding protein [Hymenobacter arcticus]
MYIVLGATGHVGSAVARGLLAAGEAVTVVTRDPNKAAEWQQQGATVAVVDVHEVDQLRHVLQRGKRLFVLNPPAPPATDTATEERRSVAAILAALAGSGIEKIVAESTYGAQPGDQIGDLGVLYELEQGLVATGIPTTIIRAAYYMSNWDMSFPIARQQGQVLTLYPPDFTLPMVAPDDIGQVATRLLRDPLDRTGLHYVEGPAAYSSADVAAAFATALAKPVQAVEIPRDQWLPSLTKQGFSEKAANSMAAMTALTLEQQAELPTAPLRGTTTLQDYVRGLVQSR